MFWFLNLVHSDLVGIWYLVLGIFMIFVKQVISQNQSIAYLNSENLCITQPACNLIVGGSHWI